MSSITLKVQNMTTGKYLGVYNATIKPGSSVYEAMEQVQADGSTNFSFQTTGAAPVHKVTVINGLQEDSVKKTKWDYYINGVHGSKSIDDYKPGDGATIEWQYEHY